MADKKQEFKQLKELEQTKLDPVKINFGWRGYVPGYKRRVVGQINRQIKREFSDPEQQDSEIEYANQLAFEREEEAAVEKQVEEIKNEGASFGSPSLIRYFILLFIFAIPNDVVDTLELTGFLIILAWFVSFFLSMGSILFSWFTDHEQKRADLYMKRLEAFRATVVHRARTVFRLAKFFRKNPTMKLIAGAVAEMIPFISLFPWSTIAVIWAYVDERKDYRNAKESGEEIYSQTV